MTTAPMQWTAVSGSWRHSTPQLLIDVQEAVQAELVQGRGIVTGGALGVDFEATKVSLAQYPDGSHLKVIIPTPLAVYRDHYEARAQEGVISNAQCLALIAQLTLVQSLGRLVELPYTVVTQETYYARNDEVVNASSRLLAFQVAGSAGTQDAIDTALKLSREVQVLHYSL